MCVDLDRIIATINSELKKKVYKIISSSSSIELVIITQSWISLFLSGCR